MECQQCSNHPTLTIIKLLKLNSPIHFHEIFISYIALGRSRGIQWEDGVGRKGVGLANWCTVELVEGGDGGGGGARGCNSGINEGCHIWDKRQCIMQDAAMCKIKIYSIMSQYNQQASSLALAAPSTIFQAILQPDEKWALHCHKSDIASKVNLALVVIMTLTIVIIIVMFIIKMVSISIIKRKDHKSKLAADG